VGVAVAGGIFIVPLYATMQDLSDPTMRARVIAANNIVSAVFMAGAALLISVLSALGLAGPPIFLLLALGNGAAAARLWRRRKRRKPAQPA
jgi:O-antigen/teichoic acid export membrane protein